RNVAARIAVIEVLPEELLRIDVLLDPSIARRPGAQDDAVGSDQRVADAVAGGTGGCFRAPDEFQRVPAHAALPGDVDSSGGVAVPRGAFVATARQHLGAPAPFHVPHAMLELVGDAAEQRDRSL